MYEKLIAYCPHVYIYINIYIVSTGTIYNDVNDPSLTEILVAHTNGIACYNRDQPGLIFVPSVRKSNVFLSI